MDDEPYAKKFGPGRYQCSKCGAELFDGDAKFDSGTRWPSFRKGLPDRVATKPDRSFGMARTEILCKKCGQHLGHVFDDGRLCGDQAPEAGKRFCVLSSALNFEEKKPTARRPA